MLASRIFTSGDQSGFATLTGDFNPVHLDALAARRTQAGAPIVHGVHALLWLMDVLAIRYADLPSVASIKVRFSKMIHVGDTAEAFITHRDRESLRAEIRVDDTVALGMSIAFGMAGNAAAPPYENAEIISPAKEPLDLRLEEMDGRQGKLDLARSPEKMENAFPDAARWLGSQTLAAIGGTTLLVGMVVPGRHSLYAGLTLSPCETRGGRQELAFKVSKADPRFRLVRMDIYGCDIMGTLETFVRRPPVVQPSFEAISGTIGRDEFSGISALIVGGSRGLGELTAKIIAAGGGDVAITYAAGKADCEAVAADITGKGGQCQTFSYDIRQPADGQLSALKRAATDIYYFATPAIFRGKPGSFSQKLFDEFNAFYISGFYELIQACSKRRPAGLRIFYPSSVAVEDRPQGMLEYAMSKAAGEILCADINKQKPGIHISVSRLPRLLTDQTATLQHIETPSPLDVLLPIVRKLSGGKL